MHALVVRVTIHNADRTRDVLNSQVVPQVSGAPGFKTGYWTWSTGGGELNGLSLIIFDSEENARAAGDRVSAIAADARDDVTLDGVVAPRFTARLSTHAGRMRLLARVAGTDVRSAVVPPPKECRAR